MRFVKTASLAAVLLCSLLSVSFAGTTAVYDDTNPSSELDLHQILLKIAQDETGDSTLKLGSWTYGDEVVIETAGGDAVIRYFRVDDTGGTSPLDIKSAGTGFNDQIWMDGTTTISAEAKYAGHNHEFGWLDNTNAGATDVVFGSTANAVLNGTTVTTGFSSNFEWYLYDKNSGDIWYSDIAGNSDGEDHMVTFEMQDANGNAFKGARTWVTAWEDLDHCKWDRDYNDFAALFSVNAVPLPSATWLGLVGLMGLAGLRRIRRRRS